VLKAPEANPHAASALRILIVSGIRLYREGLALVLAQQGDTGEVSTCEEPTVGLELARQFHPDIILLDMSASGSTSAARALARVAPNAKIIALAVRDCEPHVLACAEAGVVGYVPREGSVGDLVTAIRHAARDEALCSPVIAAGLMRHVAMLSTHSGMHSSVRRLTAREREIADQIALGMSNRAVAAQLGIELCTVKNHVHNILEKLGVSQRGEIVAYLRH